MSRQWGPCDKHGADLPCAQCQPLDYRGAGIVRRFDCTTCGSPSNVRQYEGGDLSVGHVDSLLAAHQHPATTGGAA